MPNQGAGRPRGTIVRRGDRKWLVRVSLGVDLNGRRVRVNKTVFGTKADAQRALTDLFSRRDTGLPVNFGRQTLGAWIVEWLQTWCKEISDRTRRDYADNARLYVPESLKVRPLVSVT